MLGSSNFAGLWTVRHHSARAAIGAFSIALLLLSASGSQAYAKPKASSQKWVGTWATAPLGAVNAKKEVGASDQTFRQIVRVSLGGAAVRVTLSNEFGTEPLTIGAASIALSADAGTIHSSGSTAITFGGATAITIPPGALVVSDRIALQMPPLASVAVDLFVPAQTISQLTLHPDSQQKNYAASGNQVGVNAMNGAKGYSRWYFLKGLDVEAGADSGAIITFGDSITDGHKSTEDANARWPDALAERLQKDGKTKNLAVLNEGISGNRLLRDLGGPDALARFDRDVLGQSGVGFLIILEGINDIGHVDRPAFPGDTVTAKELIFALSQLTERAHAHGIKVIGATLTPYPGKGPASPQIIALQDAENQWIRTTDKLDGVIDFDAITRNPAKPETLLPAYDSGDNLHPGDAGYKAMANGIDLKIFTKE
jgi:lysophospholipase L1-like esterase